MKHFCMLALLVVSASGNKSQEHVHNVSLTRLFAGVQPNNFTDGSLGSLPNSGSGRFMSLNPGAGSGRLSGIPINVSPKVHDSSSVNGTNWRPKSISSITDPVQVFLRNLQSRNILPPDLHERLRQNFSLVLVSKPSTNNATSHITTTKVNRDANLADIPASSSTNRSTPLPWPNESIPVPISGTLIGVPVARPVTSLPTSGTSSVTRRPRRRASSLWGAVRKLTNWLQVNLGSPGNKPHGIPQLKLDKRRAMLTEIPQDRRTVQANRGALMVKRPTQTTVGSRIHNAISAPNDIKHSRNITNSDIEAIAHFQNSLAGETDTPKRSPKPIFEALASQAALQYETSPDGTSNPQGRNSSLYDNHNMLEIPVTRYNVPNIVPANGYLRSAPIDVVSGGHGALYSANSPGVGHKTSGERTNRSQSNINVRKVEKGVGMLEISPQNESTKENIFGTKLIPQGEVHDANKYHDSAEHRNTALTDSEENPDLLNRKHDRKKSPLSGVGNTRTRIHQKIRGLMRTRLGVGTSVQSNDTHVRPKVPLRSISSLYITPHIPLRKRPAPAQAPVPTSQPITTTTTTSATPLPNQWSSDDPYLLPSELSLNNFSRNMTSAVITGNISSNVSNAIWSDLVEAGASGSDAAVWPAEKEDPNETSPIDDPLKQLVSQLSELGSRYVLNQSKSYLTNNYTVKLDELQSQLGQLSSDDAIDVLVRVGANLLASELSDTLPNRLGYPAEMMKDGTYKTPMEENKKPREPMCKCPKSKVSAGVLAALTSLIALLIYVASIATISLTGGTGTATATATSGRGGRALLDTVPGLASFSGFLLNFLEKTSPFVDDFNSTSPARRKPTSHPALHATPPYPLTDQPRHPAQVHSQDHLKPEHRYFDTPIRRFVRLFLNLLLGARARSRNLRMLSHPYKRLEESGVKVNVRSRARPRVPHARAPDGLKWEELFRSLRAAQVTKAPVTAPDYSAPPVTQQAEMKNHRLENDTVTPRPYLAEANTRNISASNSSAAWVFNLKSMISNQTAALDRRQPFKWRDAISEKEPSQLQMFPTHSSPLLRKESQYHRPVMAARFSSPHRRPSPRRRPSRLRLFPSWFWRRRSSTSARLSGPSSGVIRRGQRLISDLARRVKTAPHPHRWQHRRRPPARGITRVDNRGAVMGGEGKQEAGFRPSSRQSHGLRLRPQGRQWVRAKISRRRPRKGTIPRMVGGSSSVNFGADEGSSANAMQTEKNNDISSGSSENGEALDASVSTNRGLNIRNKNKKMRNKGKKKSKKKKKPYAGPVPGGSHYGQTKTTRKPKPKPYSMRIRCDCKSDLKEILGFLPLAILIGYSSSAAAAASAGGATGGAVTVTINDADTTTIANTNSPTLTNTDNDVITVAANANPVNTNTNTLTNNDNDVITNTNTAMTGRSFNARYKTAPVVALLLELLFLRNVEPELCFRRRLCDTVRRSRSNRTLLKIASVPANFLLSSHRGEDFAAYQEVFFAGLRGRCSHLRCPS